MLMSFNGKDKKALVVGAPRSKVFLHGWGNSASYNRLLGPTFVFCLWHILNLVKKLAFKTKNLKSDIVKERI